MTITYDPETKRATHLESGLSVQYSRRGPRFQDMEEYFNVKMNVHILEFRSIVSNGHSELRDKFPNLDTFSLSQKVRELNMQKFDVEDSRLIQFLDSGNNQRLIETFLETWWNVVRQMDRNRSRIFVVFDSIVNNVPSHWEYSG